MQTNFEFFPEKKLIRIKFVAENENDKRFLAIVREKVGYRRFSSEILSSTFTGGECRKMELYFEASPES